MRDSLWLTTGKPKGIGEKFILVNYLKTLGDRWEVH